MYNNYFLFMELDFKLQCAAEKRALNKSDLIPTRIN